MTAGVTVRRGGPDDIPGHAAVRGIGPGELASYTAWVTAHTATHLPFVADLDGRVVGVAWLYVAARVPGPGAPVRRFGDVQAVDVHADHRNRGIGGALIAALLAEARALGLLFVTVHSGRRAVDFYLRAGFTHHRQLLLWEP
ncbi:GNAT family N-acetyltransferase [Actinoplanes sp. NPDC051851]|uniref:GNAT family N-acetyltransferase n=1 Tax=Actinoplanes sp. NPDC051851 TaxID=3154753 RepID=UPI00341CD99C